MAVDLGAGEREAISLALDLGAHLLLIDERAGREQATARHLEVTGTLAVLLRAGIMGLVDFPNTLDRIQRYGFRVSPAVKATMLSKYDQARKEAR